MFSFSEGETLDTDITVTIKFGEDGNPINTSLTRGMSLDECVSKINDWAFQEYSDWTNANKGTTGITEIDLTYSGGDDGKPDVLATYNVRLTSQISIIVSIRCIAYQQKTVLLQNQTGLLMVRAQ